MLLWCREQKLGTVFTAMWGVAAAFNKWRAAARALTRGQIPSIQSIVKIFPSHLDAQPITASNNNNQDVCERSFATGVFLQFSGKEL